LNSPAQRRDSSPDRCVFAVFRIPNNHVHARCFKRAQDFFPSALGQVIWKKFPIPHDHSHRRFFRIRRHITPWYE
jgi:hypothetical protein